MIRYHQNTYNKLEKSIMISDKHVQEQYKKTPHCLSFDSNQKNMLKFD